MSNRYYVSRPVSNFHQLELSNGCYIRSKFIRPRPGPTKLRFPSDEPVGQLGLREQILIRTIERRRKVVLGSARVILPRRSSGNRGRICQSTELHEIGKFFNFKFVVVVCILFLQGKASKFFFTDTFSSFCFFSTTMEPVSARSCTSATESWSGKPTSARSSV